jgi:hypothetical protein
MLEELEFKSIDFEFNSSQQFATVVFDIYHNEFDITVLKQGSYDRFKGTLAYEKYNPSSERSSTCVYVREENNIERVIKICTIQHKGKTKVQIYNVDKLELKEFNL